jgi:chromosome segregation ATPase
MIMGVMAEHWYYWVLGVAALVGALIALYKLKPESTKIFVETAKVTVDLANEQRDDLLAKMAGIEERMTMMEGSLRDANERATAANARADIADRQVHELQDALKEEQDKVRRLQATIAALRAVLKDHNIEIPTDLPDGVGA